MPAIQTTIQLVDRVTPVLDGFKQGFELAKSLNGKENLA